MTRNCHSPLLVQKPVFGLNSGDSGNCQYPLLRSIVEIQEDPATWSRLSLTLGRGYESFW